MAHVKAYDIEKGVIFFLESSVGIWFNWKLFQHRMQLRDKYNIVEF